MLRMSVPRILSTFVVVIIIIVSIGVLFLYANRNALIKEAIVEIGTRVLQTEVSIRNVDLDVLKYTVTINGFSIKNPKNFQQTEAIGFESISVTLPDSLSLKPIHIQSVIITEPRIHFFHNADGDNLSTLLDNAKQYTPEEDNNESAPENLIKIDTLSVRAPAFKISSYLLPEKTFALDMPDINADNIGTPNGIPPNELASTILSKIVDNAFNALSKQTDQLLDAANKIIENLTQQGTNSVEEATEVVDNLLKDAEKLFQ